MPIYLSIFISDILIMLCVGVAVLLLSFKHSTLHKISMFLISLSAGTLMGGAFLHLLPEALKQLSANEVFYTFLSAFAGFFLVEKILHWRHCHKENCSIHSFGYMSLIGDAIHNFIDGLVIAGTFMVDFSLGVATTIAVATHEIPQEIGDFGVLIHAGFTKKNAILVNFAVASTVLAGGIAGYLSFSWSQNILPYLLPFAAGGFVYIAASDLMPELKKEPNLLKSLASFGLFVVGIMIVHLVSLIEG